MYGSYWWIKEVSEPPSHSFHSFAPKYLISLFIGHLNPTSLSSVVAQLCLTLCDHMDCCTPGLLVHHQFMELAQTHGHQLGDANQPSHSLSSPSPPTLNLFQLQGLFQ